ncbi:hypothetical protein AB433_12790 [Croceicoccus naphthovorans]|uniref:DUF4139 domain-containing protein n=1 Tax=Croceicoccus naphthovorans TaxID=1348774 RepID=A0A0G3XHH4_9SPHN|nr:hypothetical protein AB433_12790 [Croceicoccus naphthovorans]
MAGAALAITAPAFGQNDPTGQSQQGDVSVTIYNNNQALVQDVRQLSIAQGRSRIEFPDVSAQIRPETLSFVADGTTIIEQNFDFDLLTPGKLMEKAVGETITLIRTNPATGAETRERAKVLSVAGGTVVQIGDRIEVLRDDGLPVRAVFDKVPDNLRARPTLSVTVDSNRSGRRPVSLRYLTPGLGWAADYVALYDEARGTVDMQGWVTLTNNTGTTFQSVKTMLVAGNPQSEQSGYNRRGRGYAPPPPPPMRGDVERMGTESADRERLGDFYLYPLDERTTIANAQTKQVSFLDVSAVPASKVYARTVGWLQSDSDPVKASSEIAFSSSRQGGLGDALPAGTVRFYQRDARGTPQFIGENAIGHTPMGSRLSLRTGDAFDVSVQATVVSRTKIASEEYERSSKYRVITDGRVRTVEVQDAKEFYRTTMRYHFTNARAVPVTVDLTQSGLDRGWWSHDFRVVSEGIKGEQLDLNRRQWSVSVPANGEYDLTVVYETRY